MGILPPKCQRPPSVEYDEESELEQGKQRAKELLDREPWYRGAGIGAAEDGEHFAVTVRVAPGFGGEAERRVAGLDLPVFFTIVETEGWGPRPAVVASAWLRSKVAFNKENPTDLVKQLAKILDKAQTGASTGARKRLRDSSSQIRNLGRAVQEAWERRREV